MAYQILEMIYYLVYAVELFLIGDGIFHNRVREKAKYAIVAVVYLPVITTTLLPLNNNTFIISALNIFMYIVLFQGNIFSNIVHYVGVSLLINMVESAVFGMGVILFKLSLTPLGIGTVRLGVFSLLFAVVITGVILFVISRKWTQNFILYFRSLNWFQYLVIALIVWSGILLLGIITVMPEYIEDSNKSGMLFALTTIFMATALVGVTLLVINVYGRDYYLRQNKIKEEIIHVQQMYFQSIYDNDREMRKFRHDISSQLRFLGWLLADGKTDQALEHLQIIGSHFEELEIPKYHTGNKILDVIINQKVQEAKNKGINIEFEGKMDKPDLMDTYDLCTLFSNMLDNSIEACEAIQNYEDVITVSILTHRNTVLFQFTNPATDTMYEAIKQGRTTKADNIKHGFGMENVRRVVDKYGGETEYLFKDGKLIVEMYFEGNYSE